MNYSGTGKRRKCLPLDVFDGERRVFETDGNSRTMIHVMFNHSQIADSYYSLHTVYALPKVLTQRQHVLTEDNADFIT